MARSPTSFNPYPCRVADFLGGSSRPSGRSHDRGLFFDQFEKVFEYPEVTSSIRTLFLSVTEKQLPILFGFAWKSDLWSLAEGFPHHERDDIVRESIQLRTLTQFGQEETA